MWNLLPKTDNSEDPMRGYATIQIVFNTVEGYAMHVMLSNHSLVRQTRDEIYRIGFRANVFGEDYYVAPGAIVGYKVL